MQAHIILLLTYTLRLHIMYIIFAAYIVHCCSFRLVYYYNIAIVHSCQVHIFKWIMRLYVGNMENINSYCKAVHGDVYCNCTEGKVLEHNRKEKKK